MSLQEQEQQRQQAAAGVPDLEQVLLPGSHITPCGAQLQSPVTVGPFDLLLRDTSGPGSQADLQNLAQKVLTFLDSRRQASTQRRAAMQQQQQSSAIAPESKSRPDAAAAGVADDDASTAQEASATVAASVAATRPGV